MLLLTWWASRRVELTLRLREPVPVRIEGRLPVSAHITQKLNVALPEEVAARVALGELAIPIEQTLTLPLAMRVEVPIDSEVSMDQTLDLALEVALDTEPLAARLETKLEAEVEVKQPAHVRLGALTMGASDLTLQPR